MIDTPEPIVLGTLAVGFSLAALGVMLTAPEEARLDIIELTDLAEAAVGFGVTEAEERDCGLFCWACSVAVECGVMLTDPEIGAFGFGWVGVKLTEDGSDDVIVTEPDGFKADEVVAVRGFVEP